MSADLAQRFFCRTSAARTDLDGRKIMACALQLADALAHVLRHNILHRDLKPDNVARFPVFEGEAGECVAGAPARCTLAAADVARDVSNLMMADPAVCCPPAGPLRCADSPDSCDVRCGHAATVSIAQAAPVQWSWRLLDFSAACALPAEQTAAPTVIGTSGYVPPCASRASQYGHNATPLQGLHESDTCHLRVNGKRGLDSANSRRIVARVTSSHACV